MVAKGERFLGVGGAHFSSVHALRALLRIASGVGGEESNRGEEQNDYASPYPGGEGRQAEEDRPTDLKRPTAWSHCCMLRTRSGDWKNVFLKCGNQFCLFILSTYFP